MPDERHHVLDVGQAGLAEARQRGGRLVIRHGVLAFGRVEKRRVHRARPHGRDRNAALAKFESNLSSLEPSKDKALLDQGRQVYTTYCAPCHRPDGGGLVGPNLCDDYWIHGPTYQDNLKTIINGVPAKGMLTWRGVLKPQEIQAVASHIFGLRGSNPPNPKPPENLAPTDANKPSEFE